jgi:hypothetical protein
MSVVGHHSLAHVNDAEASAAADARWRARLSATWSHLLPSALCEEWWGPASA